jgi:hypothetical protein
LGEVNSPGEYNIIRSNQNILHLLGKSQDLTEFANRKRIKVIRKNGVESTRVIYLDLTDPETWLNAGDTQSFSAIFCINIFQVAPISIADGMMKCAAHLLSEDGFLLIYGPFQVSGQCTTESNQKFHDTLSSAGVSEWGLKDVADLKAAAAKYGMELKEQIDMPVNNFSLIFGRK